MAPFADNFQIGNYTIVYFIKETLFCSSYRVLDLEGRSFFMKVFNMYTMPKELLVSGIPMEIWACKNIKHGSFIKYVDNGRIDHQGISYHYLITDFIVGELLSESLLYNGLLTIEDKLRIARDIAEGLKYMYEQIGVIHNDICPQNIVLVSDPRSVRLVPKIIDLGHASKPFNGTPTFPEEDIELKYRAPETFSGMYSDKSDVYSFSLVLFEMLFGRLPWNLEINEKAEYRERIKQLKAQRCYPVEIPSEDADIITLLSKGLSEYPGRRPSYDEILALLPENAAPLSKKPNTVVLAPSYRKGFIRSCPHANSKGGFADVAGMDSLKKELTDKVIWVLKNKKVAELYRITPLNGMLLYGPPGCGKTFFAQKFAEESGFNYRLINGSDIGSTLVHGSQLHIADLFKEAEMNAPTVLCFDEFDAFVPTRGARGTEYASEEVNEFLSQINNCAQRGIFVIGTTNRKDMIDPAILRKGRLDLHFYIPEPDLEMRKIMFQKHLENRPLSDDIDYVSLALMTDNYASSDIAFIVNEAALAAALAGELISQRHLEGSIKGNKSSLDTISPKRSKIGF